LSTTVWGSTAIMLRQPYAGSLGHPFAKSILYLRTDVSRSQHRLRFEQFGSHPGTRNLRALSYNAFTFCSL